ncbi:MAG: undecaprenyldiphospho-muramoylpentapeptide beta-N-acetylglucosaminyltransferase [Candidatus Puniceispirillaceae bacterium]
MAKVILAAGGTGGHIFPALAVAEILETAGHQVILFTDKRGVAMVDGKITYRQISSASPFNSGLLSKLTGLIRLAFGLLQSLASFALSRPACVIGFGGYPSLAPLMAGRLMGAKCILHEQNAIMGRANRLLGKFAHHIALTFADTKGAPQTCPQAITGLPVRGQFHEIAAYQPSDSCHITIIGGSLGAQIFADIVPEAISQLRPSDKRTIRISQQCRDEHVSLLQQAYKALGVKAEVARFYHDMADLYRRSDIIISRAGASSVAEIASAGRPSILVPFAGALDDHQTGNARQLSDQGGAYLIAEKDASADKLAAILSVLISQPDKRTKMAETAKTLSEEGAASAIAGLTGLPLSTSAVTGEVQ